MGELFLQASIIILLLMTLLWLWSIAIKNASIVDIFWGMGFVIVNTFNVFASGDLNPRKVVVLALVSIWGIRLSSHIFMRNLGKEEDFRYQEFRRRFGPQRYWWVSFFQTFLLQGVLMMMVSLSLIGISLSVSSGELVWIDYVAIGVWIVGFSFEAGGDFQLLKFKENPDNRGKVLDKGFWRYTRHPNYFGDATVWWAFALFSISAGGYWNVIGSVIMTLLLVKVSGVGLLEKTLKKTKPQYEEYARKTNSFFPWLPKK